MKVLNIETPASKQAGDLASDFGLQNHGLTHLNRVYWNLPVSALYEEAVWRREGLLTAGGPLLVNTKPHTARAAADKFVVQEESTASKIWWGEHNRPFSTEKFNGLLSRLTAYLQGRDLFVQDCFVGADPDYRMPIRIITEHAWASPALPPRLRRHRHRRP